MALAQHTVRIDPWTYYDYKATFEGSRVVYNPPRWATDHHRRLRAYMLLESYVRNVARTWLDAGVLSQTQIDDRREYGESDIIVETALASLLGDDMSIVVSVAGEPDPPAAALEQQKLLRAWGENERLEERVMDCERKACRLGDGVYALAWDAENSRPRLTVYDPSTYFPVLDLSEVSDDFPKKTHIAWEWEEREDNGECKFYLRRLTWEIVDTVDARNYPWNNDPVNRTCIFTDMTWQLEDTIENLVDLSDGAGISNLGETLDEPDFMVDSLDLNIDFIPIIHIPNTIPGEDHFGTAVLAKVVQALDDIVMTDTDLQASSRTTGSPPIAVAGTTLPTAEDGTIAGYGPGTVWHTGDGTATMIDTSTSLDALLKYAKFLREILSVNSRTPEALLGRVKPNEVPSGIALTLSFSPHSHMIREMRLVRKSKYRLLFKFVMRFLQANNLAPETEIFTTDLHFGSYLPSDRQETGTLVNQLYRAVGGPMISLETAVRMLMEAGFPIEDAAAELDAIRHSDFKRASEALDATGDVNFARDQLGLGPVDTAALGGSVPTPPVAPPVPAPAPAP